MDIHPLTRKERAFAEANHDLVYAFLNRRKLPEEDYYDIVIFGYLHAVQEYCATTSLHRFKFSTVAWRRMQGAYANYLKYLSCAKRNAPTVSLDESIGHDGGLRVEDIIVRADESMIEFQCELLLQELEQVLSPRAMRIVRRRVNGERMHDIAKAERMTFREINRLLEQIYPTVIKVFYGSKIGGHTE